MRTSNTAETKTVNMARASATLPRVEGPTSLHLSYTQQFLDRKAPRHGNHSLLRKFFEIVDPRVWTMGFLAGGSVTLAAATILNSAYRAQASLFQTPLFPTAPIAHQLQWGLAFCAAFTVFIFHFLLNYRRRGRGGLIKAYWYAGWAFTLGFFFLPQVHQPLSHHRANQINEYCFTNKKTDKCNRYLKLVYKGQRPRDVLQLMPEKKRAWVDAQFKKIDPPLVALNEESTRPKKSQRRLASPISLPR